MNADIITIGDEILIGQIVDTNSAWMANKLNESGINVRQMLSISDHPGQILSTLQECCGKVAVVLITGGLGPTKDDRTKSAMCTFFDTHLVEDSEVLEHVIEILKPRGIPINTLNREQAMVPASAKVLHNKLGTAPGLWFEHQQTIFVFMPGVPFEMKYLMEHEVIPQLEAQFETPSIIHRTVLTHGIAESSLAEKIAEWEDNLPPSISLAYLPSPQSVRLRLTARGGKGEALQQELENQVEELSKLIPGFIFGFEEDTMAGVIGKILENNRMTVAVAESCTGGTIAHYITANPGSSAYFKGCVVAYSNEIKTRVLGVDPQLIDQYGAVSQEVVEAMALGVRHLMDCDYAIATSGIAGPAGGTPEKPVGTVWTAVAGPGFVRSKRFNFANNRERNIIRASHSALNLLRLELLNH